jgi:hypothetical protein
VAAHHAALAQIPGAAADRCHGPVTIFGDHCRVAPSRSRTGASEPFSRRPPVAVCVLTMWTQDGHVVYNVRFNLDVTTSVERKFSTVQLDEVFALLQMISDQCTDRTAQ